MQADDVVRGYSCLKIQLDTERTELNCYGTYVCATLNHWERKLSTSQESGFLSIQSHEVRLRQNLEHRLLFEGLDRHGEVQIGPEQENIQNVTQSEGR